MKVSEQQRQEWTENPVTIALKELYAKELENIDSGPDSDCLIRGEPQLTQENLIEKAARELEIFLFLDVLNGNWDARPPGGRFKREWFKFLDERPPGLERVRRWDLAATRGIPVGSVDRAFAHWNRMWRDLIADDNNVLTDWEV